MNCIPGIAVHIPMLRRLLATALLAGAAAAFLWMPAPQPLAPAPSPLPLWYPGAVDVWKPAGRTCIHVVMGRPITRLDMLELDDLSCSPAFVEAHYTEGGIERVQIWSREAGRFMIPAEAATIPGYNATPPDTLFSRGTP